MAIHCPPSPNWTIIFRGNAIDVRGYVSDDECTQSNGGKIMTDARERGRWRRYGSAAIAVVCSSNDHREASSWPEYKLLGRACSPP
jgi:hypothetical protein